MRCGDVGERGPRAQWVVGEDGRLTSSANHREHPCSSSRESGWPGDGSARRGCNFQRARGFPQAERPTRQAGTRREMPQIGEPATRGAGNKPDGRRIRPARCLHTTRCSPNAPASPSGEPIRGALTEKDASTPMLKLLGGDGGLPESSRNTPAWDNLGAGGQKIKVCGHSGRNGLPAVRGPTACGQSGPPRTCSRNSASISDRERDGPWTRNSLRTWL